MWQKKNTVLQLPIEMGIGLYSETLDRVLRNLYCRPFRTYQKNGQKGAETGQYSEGFFR